ncbi:conjugal transfer protein TraC [Burkholderia multivorans]|uniref:Conjugal transfer protein TraC n=1 Tax=Burkholderia multivorans TaxID=87883 RepID=A0AAP2MRW1_9BURK|nr:conjugal transfer protein TraC [Burkholderia multivorans]MBU9360224.1 conjugal transfer protein TraC [Burkholderia multivorans]MBU9368868.1 conjugal transfer protein TraC [Burkholderia multivorans]HDR9017879.1 VirB4 family type IV secretion system protein [Burkholderia vietnamiensis]
MLTPASARSPFDAEPLARIEQRTDGDRRASAELVPWLFRFSDALVVNKDSAVMATYGFSGPDADALSTSHVLELMDNLVTSLRDMARRPVTMWWTVHRRRSAQYLSVPMPDPVSQRIDDARRTTFEQAANYTNRHFVTLTLAPEVGIDRFAGKVTHGMTHDDLSLIQSLVQAVRGTFSDQYLFAYTASELRGVVETFENLLFGFTASNPRLDCHRLSGPELGAFMHACCSPPGDDLPAVAVPDIPALDLAMCDAEVRPGHDYLHFYAGGRQRFGIAAGIPARRDFWPDSVLPTSLDGLLKVPGELTVSHCFRLATPTAAMRFINGVRRYHEGRRLDTRSLLAATLRGGDMSGARQNQARSAAADDANRRAGRVEMAEEVYGYYNLSVLSYSPVFETSPFDDGGAAEAAWMQAVTTHKAVEEALRDAHFTPVRETLHALSAFATTVPGMWRECARWAFIDTGALARLLPLRGVLDGHRINRHLSKETGALCPALAAFPTEFGTPYWFTGFLGDVGHMLVCGRTGFGKTIFMLLCATLFRKYPDAWLYGFDKDLSMRIPTMLQGGRYMQFDSQAAAVHADERAQMNPLVLLADPRHLEFLSEWIILLVQQRGTYRVTAADRRELETSLAATRSRADHRLWRLRTVHASLPAGPLADELALWVGSAVHAHYFDNVDDSFDDSHWVSMATDRILGNPVVARPFLSYVTYRIQDSLEQRRARGVIGPTLVMLPEIWNLLDDEAFAAQIGNWIVTMRKKLGCVWMDAQSPEQVSSSAIWPQIRDNVLVRVFVPVENFTPSARAAYQRDFGLSDGQIRTIQKLVAKRDYFIAEQGGASRRVSVPLDPVSIAILRSEMSAQIMFDRHLHSGLPDWKERYIDEATAQARGDSATQSWLEVAHA